MPAGLNRRKTQHRQLLPMLLQNQEQKSPLMILLARRLKMPVDQKLLKVRN